MMHEYTQIAERMRIANPVPDPAEPPVRAAGADVVLLEIERRSTTVQTTDRNTQETMPPQRRWSRAWAAAAAFAAVIIIAGLTILFGPNSTDEPAATTTTEATTTTLSVGEMESSIASELEIAPGSVRQVAFGPVNVDTGAVPFSIVIPDWSSDYDEQPWLAAVPPGTELWIGAPIDNQGREIDRVGLLNFIDTRANDDYAQVATDIEGELPATSVTETTVGGAPAVLIDVGPVGSEAPLDSFGTVLIPGEEGEVPAFWMIEDEQARIYVIGAPTGTLIIAIQIDPEGGDTLTRYWEELVASIQFDE